MDPNATLKQIGHVLGDAKDELCDDLRAWIRHGGFEPDWSAYPLAASYYKTRAEEVRASFGLRQGGNVNLSAGEVDITRAKQVKRDSQNTTAALVRPHGAPSPEALASNAEQLYAAVICLLADYETTGVIGGETYLQARRAVFAVHGIRKASA